MGPNGPKSDVLGPGTVDLWTFQDDFFVQNSRQILTGGGSFRALLLFLQAVGLRSAGESYSIRSATAGSVRIARRPGK